MLWVFISVLAAYYVYEKIYKPSLYWTKRGVFHSKPWVRFFKTFIRRKAIAETVKEAYDLYPDRRYFGSFQFLYPSLFLRDIDLIKKVTVKDFEHFPDHLLVFNNDNDPLTNSSLFALKGEKWKNMRATLSPAFTSSKMKSMFILMNEIAENYVKNLGRNEEKLKEIEMKDLFSKYTTDIIATCAFGIDVDSLENDQNDFFFMGKAITKTTILGALKAVCIGFFPKITGYFGLRVFPSKVTDFFSQTMKETIAYREKQNIVRPDMVHLLLEARRGNLKIEDKENVPETGFATVKESYGIKSSGKIEITDDLMTGQALIFFFAGFETGSTVMSFLSYELALNTEIQSKLQQEIDEAMQKCNDNITYEEILSLKYLDQVISETLRKYPPGFALNRQCTKNYKIEAKLEHENDLIVEKGCSIVIPVFAIHRDPQFFPEPDKFEPDRFSEENKGNILAGTYMPFGSGPRNCIASRFALLETKALMVQIFSKFEVYPIEKTSIPLKLAKTQMLGSADGFWLGLRKRNDK
ncbi:unnamed protein product [Brassicogethes aeneus]|uniref:Cytochrome P450 n=1 Tax=Brassicogethes aeneus TaxID=1431903 RepID=A0A9P0BI52_BRAAE|nr:unnamed protein product [Brassicogethes aeneus]